MVEKLGRLVLIAVIVVVLLVLVQLVTGYGDLFGGVEFRLPWENVAGDVYRGVMDGLRPGLR